MAALVAVAMAAAPSAEEARAAAKGVAAMGAAMAA